MRREARDVLEVVDRGRANRRRRAVVACRRSAADRAVKRRDRGGEGIDARGIERAPAQHAIERVLRRELPHLRTA